MQFAWRKSYSWIPLLLAICSILPPCNSRDTLWPWIWVGNLSLFYKFKSCCNLPCKISIFEYFAKNPPGSLLRGCNCTLPFSAMANCTLQFRITPNKRLKSYSKYVLLNLYEFLVLSRIALKYRKKNRFIEKRNILGKN